MRNRGIPLVVLAALLAGCSYPIVGTEKQYSEVIYGTLSVNPLTGRGFVEAQGLIAKVRCAGPASINNSLRTLVVAEQTSGGVLTCENGQVVNMSYARTEQGNIGIGKDQYGREFEFNFGMSEVEAAAKADEYMRKAAAVVTPAKLK